MKLSTKTQYGLRILLFMSESSSRGELAQGKEIAGAQNINEPYLEQIMITLKKAGLVSTVRGRRGGYQLARDPKEIDLNQLVEVFEGKVCLGESEPPARREARAANAVWAQISTDIRNRLADISLADIIEAHLHQGPDYMI